MINNLTELMIAEKKPHVQMLLQFMFDGYTFESSKRKTLDRYRQDYPLVTWGDLENGVM